MPKAKLSPSRRIQMIKQIVNNLSTHSWRDIDLALSQFGFPYTDNWQGSGDMKDYIIDMVSSSEDEKLLELHAYTSSEGARLGVNSEALTKSVERCWSHGTVKVFISHSYIQKEEVMKLKEKLSLFGITAFVAHEDIEVAEEWEKEIICGLDTCDVVVAWVTEDFKSSFWAQQEIGYAKAKNKMIIPVRRGLDPFGFIERIQGVNGREDRNVSSIVAHIVHVLISKPKTASLVQEGIINSLESSKNFGMVSYKLSLLEQFDNWDEEMIDKLKNFTKSALLKDNSRGHSRIAGIIAKYTENNLDSVTIDDLPF